MTPLAPSRRAAPLLLGIALIAQCLVAPWWLQRGSQPVISLVVAAALVGALLWAVPEIARGRGAAGTIALAGVPSLLALTSILTGGAVRFDPAARVVAAVTALAYFAAVASLREAVAPRVALAIRSASPSRSSSPPLRAIAWGCLVVGAFSLAVLAPAQLTARAPTGVERGLAPGFTAAREALVASAGLALALLWTLSAGPRLVRGRGSRYGRRARAVAMVVWSVAFGALWWWVDRAR